MDLREEELGLNKDKLKLEMAKHELEKKERTQKQLLDHQERLAFINILRNLNK